MGATTITRRTSLVLTFLLLCAPLFALAQEDTAAPAAPPVNNRLHLTVDAPVGPLALGDEATLTIAVTNISAEPVENVWLYLPPDRGVAWIEPAEPWLALGALAAGESRATVARLRVAGVPRSGYLRFFVGAIGDDTKPARQRVDLLVPRAGAETATAPAAGGEVAFARGRVRLAFPPGWNEQDAQLTFQLEELYRPRRREGGRLLLFTVAATAGGVPLTTFDAPVAVTLAVGDLKAGGAEEAPPAMAAAPTADGAWTPLASSFDPTTGALTFSADQFAAYQAVADPELWRPAYNPPSASAYSGAATHSYPIATPPGIGGLAPDLSLSYSSRAAEALTYPAMGQGLGAGWALPQAQITNSNSGLMYGSKDRSCSDYGNWRFTLSLNGATYYLRPQSGQVSGDRSYGRYDAIGSPELFIEYVADNGGLNNTDNVSGEFWRVVTADGTIYTFGRTEDAEQVVWPVSTRPTCNGHQPRNTAFSAYNWKLDSITDVHGNRVVYTYARVCGQRDENEGTEEDPYYPDRGENRDGGVFQCSEVDTAVETVGYNFDNGVAQTVATFAYEDVEEVNEALRHKPLSMTAGVLRPTALEIAQNGTRVARYEFAYEEDAHWFPEWESSTEFWWLTEVTQRGLNNATLPVQSFDYVDPSGNLTGRLCHDQTCVKLLGVVDNGYGAVTKIAYKWVTGSGWYYVDTVETWDGVTNEYGSDRPQTRLKLTPSADPVNGVAQLCYDDAHDEQTNPCHSEMGSGQSSEALIGFNTTTLKTQAPAAPTGNAWTTLSQTTLTFYNDDFWLLGKTRLEQQYEGDGAQLAQAEYRWTRPDSTQAYVFLDWAAHAVFDPEDNQTYLSYLTDYDYYPVNPAGGHYGGLKTRRDVVDGSIYRCTEYAYAHDPNAWLINRPERETTRGPKDSVTDVCNNGEKAAETLYRYAGSTKPSVVGLDARARLTHVLRWEKLPDTYVWDTRAYDTRGLPKQLITYGGTIAGSAGSYNGAQRGETFTTYNALGLPDSVTVSGVNMTAESQTIAYDPTWRWQVASVTDANGLATAYAYDDFGRLRQVIAPGDDADHPTVLYRYYDNGSPLLLRPLVVGVFYRDNLRSAERLFYDGLGRLVQTQTALVEVQGQGDQDIITTMAYDARGLEVCRTVPYATTNPYVPNGQTPFKSAACGSKPRAETTYDGLGRVKSVKAPDGATTRTEYEIATNVIVDGRSTFLRAMVYDGNNHLTARLSDVFGRLALVREYTGTTWDAGANVYTAYADTRYHYTPRDELAQVHSAEASNNDSKLRLRETTMTYDGLGRKTRMTDKDMGVWQYAYDPAGNLRWQQAPGNEAVCFYYDGLNRPLQRQTDNNGGDEACPAMLDRGNLAAWSPSHLASYVYGGAGNLGRVTNVYWSASPQNNNDQFFYDGQGRLSSQHREVGGQTFAYGLADYDELDRPRTFYPPSGETVAVVYDHEGENKLTAGGTTLIDKVGYNERGQLVVLSRHNGAPDTTLSYHGAADNFRLNKILHGPEGGALPDFIYGAAQYDNVGNLLGMQMKLNTATDNLSFGYDAVNRLTTASLTGAGAANYSYTYAYDPLGNLTSRLGTDPDLLAYGYGDRAASGQVPALTGGSQAVTYVDVSGTTDDWRYDYDARGNLDSKYVGTASATPAYEYTFDIENRLTAVKTNGQTTTFSYDANGQRVMTKRPDETILYTPFPDYEREVPESGPATERVTYRLAGQIVAVRAAALNYVYTDHLGNVVGFGGLGGGFTAASLARYDPFGNFRTTPTTNPGTTARGFTGHMHNNTGTNSLGLIYMNARYYLPEVGRFASADSIVPEPGNPQSYNRYSYVLNAPISLIDPTGHMPTNGCGMVEGCSMTEAERRESIVDYGKMLRWSQKEDTTDIDVLAQIMDFAAQYDTSTQEWADDLSFVIVGYTGPFTLIGGAFKLGRPAMRFIDTDLAEIYRDGTNQIYHWWGYVNTVVQGGGSGRILGTFGNIGHEFYDPRGISRGLGRTGNSWEDYALAENGITFGLKLHNGDITPDTASAAMRDALLTDSRGPMLQWLMDHISNSWLNPNIYNTIYNTINEQFGSP